MKLFEPFNLKINMKTLNRFLFIMLAIGVFFPHTPVQAKVDSRCWEQSECEKERKKADFQHILSDEEITAGFVVTSETEDVCRGGNNLGFCLPISQTKTSIAFGGKQTYLHIGDYIQTLYQYGIIAAGILSVLMIIAAGFIWTTSGGNAERIGSAKKKIAGAIMGLVLASLSYTLLNTINPAFVNIRLPQIWMIKEQSVPNAKYCVQLDEKDKISPINKSTGAPSGEFKSPFSVLPPTNAAEKIYPRRDATINDKTHISPSCGQTYASFDTGNTCLGNICPGKQFCLDEKGCVDVHPGLQGSLSTVDGKIIDNDMWMYALCEDDKIKEVGTLDIGAGITTYIFPDVDKIGLSDCKGKVKGYFLIVEFNDTDFGSTSDDQWLGGKSFCTNLSKTPSCGMYGLSTLNKSDAAEFTSQLWSYQELFTQDEIANGFICDFKTNSTYIPNIGSGLIADGVSVLGMAVADNLGVTKEDIMNFMGGLDAYYANVNFTCPALKSSESKFRSYLKARIEKSTKSTRKNLSWDFLSEFIDNN